jgi:hypothetical protein
MKRFAMTALVVLLGLSPFLGQTSNSNAQINRDANALLALVTNVGILDAKNLRVTKKQVKAVLAGANKIVREAAGNQNALAEANAANGFLATLKQSVPARDHRGTQLACYNGTNALKSLIQLTTPTAATP